MRITDGKVFNDNGHGSFVAATARSEELEPGWKTYIGFRNFGQHRSTTRSYASRSSRSSSWTFAFAASCVFFSFAVGLFLAITLDKQGMRFQRLYRSVLDHPVRDPGLPLACSSGPGLLNDDFGVVNQLFHIHVPWLFGGNVFSWLPFISLAAHRRRARQRVADDAVLLPRLARRAAVDPRAS